LNNHKYKAMNQLRDIFFQKWEGIKLPSYFLLIKNKFLTEDGLKVTLLPLFLVFINLVLKLRHFGAQSIAGDESFSIYIAQFDLSAIIHYLSQGNNPPLFEIILHYWIKIFGIGVASVRFLSCLFSSITVWYVYKIGFKFFSFKAGLLAAVLFTLSNYQMYFAHETRVYSLFLLLTCISFYAYLNLMKKGSIQFRIIHALTIVLLPYAHYLGFFVLFIQLVISLLFKETRTKTLKIYVINLMIALVCFIPFVTVFIKRLHDLTAYGTWIQPVKNLGQLHDVLKFLTNDSLTNYLIVITIIWFVIQKFFRETISGIYVRYAFSLISIFFLFYAISIMGPMPHYWEFTARVLPMISYLLFMAVLIFLFLKTDKVSIYTKVVLIWFFFPLLIMFVSSFWVPMFIDRYLIYFTGAFYLLMGIGVCYLEEGKPLQLGLLLTMLLGITFTTNVDKKRHVTEVIEKIKEIKTNKSIVYICPDNFEINFAYYYNQQYFKDIDEPDRKEKLYKHLASENIYPINSYKQIDTLIFKNADKIIYIDAAADFAYPGNGIKAKLDSTLSLKQQYEVYEIYRINEYKNKRIN